MALSFSSRHNQNKNKTKKEKRKKKKVEMQKSLTWYKSKEQDETCLRHVNWTVWTQAPHFVPSYQVWTKYSIHWMGESVHSLNFKRYSCLNMKDTKNLKQYFQMSINVNSFSSISYCSDSELVLTTYHGMTISNESWVKDWMHHVSIFYNGVYSIILYKFQH